MKNHLVLALAFALHFMRSTVARKQMCSKVLFKNINEDEMPWIQVEGVYELSSTNDGFPVYKHAITGLVFYYDRDNTQGIKILKFGEKIGQIFGLFGMLRQDFDPTVWLATGDVNRNDVFGNVVTTWRYYSPLEKTFRDASRKLKAVCVDDDVFRCSSGKVYLNDVITGSGSNILNDPKTDFFGELQSVYSEIRPVSKHNKQNWYLYYRNNYWRVGTNYAGTSNDIFRVQDLALRPELITQRWQKWTGTEWVDITSDFRVLCRGIANGENKCHALSICKNGGTCVYTRGNETVCFCTDKAYGQYCEETEKCSVPGLPSSAVDVVSAGTRPGDVATLFCTTGYRSLPVEFYVCERAHGAEGWYLESQASCQARQPTSNPGTTTPRVYPIPTEAQTTDKPWDKSLDFLIFFGPCLAFQLIIPCFIWLGLMISAMVRASKRTQARSVERTEAVGKIQRKKYKTLFRIYSAFLNFAFWAWLCFVCACASTDLQETHEYLYYCAIGMCFFCAIFVAIEGFLCRERVALQHFVTWEYITFLHSVRPVIEMEVERYDWKYVQKSGYRTNPSTGNLEYQREIRRKVGRKFVREQFVFRSWSDSSTRENTFGRELTFLCLHMDIKLEGETTKRSFEEQKEALIRKTEHLNPWYTFSRKDQTPGLHDYVILCPDRQAVPFWMEERFFWYATFMQLSWIYRLVFNMKTKFSEYTVQKEVFDDDRGTRQTGDEKDNAANTGSQATQCFASSVQNLTQSPNEVSQKTPLTVGSGSEQQNNYMTI